MNENMKIAVIVAVAIIAGVSIYTYFSPYNSCVRGAMSRGMEEGRAAVYCAKLLGGSGNH